MEERRHPTHKKVVAFLLVTLLGLSFLIFALGRDEAGGVLIFSASGILFLVLLGCALAVGMLGRHVSKCPTCKGWMRRYPREGIEDDRIRFCCKKCNVIFDTGMIMSGEP